MGNWGPETLVRTWGSGELGTRDFRSLGAGGQDPYKVQSPAKPSPMPLRQSTLRPECLSLQSFGRDRREPTGSEGVTKVRTARRVPTGNFRRTEPAQPSPGHRGDSSKMPLRDSERFGPSAHHLRVRSASTQAHSFPRHAGSGRCRAQERRAEARTLEKWFLVVPRFFWPLLSWSLHEDRGRVGFVHLCVCSAVRSSCGNDGGREVDRLELSSCNL